MKTHSEKEKIINLINDIEQQKETLCWQQYPAGSISQSLGQFGTIQIKYQQTLMSFYAQSALNIVFAVAFAWAIGKVFSPLLQWGLALLMLIFQLIILRSIYNKKSQLLNESYAFQWHLPSNTLHFLRDGQTIQSINLNGQKMTGICYTQNIFSKRTHFIQISLLDTNHPAWEEDKEIILLDLFFKSNDTETEKHVEEFKQKWQILCKKQNVAIKLE